MLISAATNWYLTRPVSFCQTVPASPLLMSRATVSADHLDYCREPALVIELRPEGHARNLELFNLVEAEIAPARHASHVRSTAGLIAVQD